MKKLITAAALVLASTSALAAQGPYIGAHYSALEVEDSGFDVDLGVLGAQAGYNFNEFFAIEGRLGFGISDDSIFGTDVELENYYGAYLVPQFQFNEVFGAYALLGFTKGKIKVSGFGSDSEDDFGYAIGARFNVAENANLFVEYGQLMDTHGVEFNTVTAGFNYRF
ncbi:porin family protein [Gallaecimonas sp. GXIMD4217]|uniref:porin family protein n=1 Tax=Gallaecimonas sp. GXIMD4217 TaxID=3131927 RepID=UPI00311AD7F0